MSRMWVWGVNAPSAAIGAAIAIVVWRVWQWLMPQEDRAYAAAHRQEMGPPGWITPIWKWIVGVTLISVFVILPIGLLMFT